jgi:CRISPR/Cas system-associated exonuclease Cas4 (RecB family)
VAVPSNFTHNCRGTPDYRILNPCIPYPKGVVLLARLHGIEETLTSDITLSKSTFLRGVQCQKSLALNAFLPDLRDPIDPVAQFRMLQGIEVGMQARLRYPGGSVGRIPDSYALSVERTDELVQSDVPVIYEAAFEMDGVRIVADILERAVTGWRLIEVKSTTEAKPEHRWDVAVQLFVLRKAGLSVEDAVLLHLNKDYIRIGEIDYEMLFTEETLLNEALDMQEEVGEVISICKETLEAGAIPDVPIGPHCTDPVDCDFISYCWKDVPDPSVFDVYFIGKKAHDLYAQGIERIEDIPEDLGLDKRSRFHIEAHKAGVAVVKPEKINRFLSSLLYPLYYLDFETFALPIPPFGALSTYDKVPFQYSLHVQSEPGQPLWHHGYLAQAGIDPRSEFIEQLLEDTEGEGSIVVYYMPFERGVLRSLEETFPEYRDEIEQRIERMVDLLEPFKQRAFWHPKMGGSNSLKRVLPVFAADLSYEQMEVSDGEQAMVAFLSLQDEGDASCIEEKRQALWDYCSLDTLAMVRILDGLRELVA